MSLENLTKELIQIESISPNDAGCFDILESELNGMNFSCERINYKNVENLYAVLGSEGPTFCFLGHTDVVPTGPLDKWTYPPFGGEIHNDHMYGRGAADMKGNICAFIDALKTFLSTEKLNFRIAVLLTSNEEGTPEDGFIDELLEKLKARGEKIDYCLVGEPSSSSKVADTIRIGRRGSLSGKLKIIGKQGHIAYPEKFVNPIFLISDLIKILKEKKWDEGNKVIAAIRETTGREPVINNGGGTSDGRFMIAMDAEIVELGPLNESIHKIDENVSLNDLKTLKEIYVSLLKNLST